LTIIGASLQHDSGSAEQRRARQDELLATLADGVLELTTSQGWRRYLRAMATLRTYSSGNSRMSQPLNCLAQTEDRRSQPIES
jgi:hypothetical protein